MSIVTNTPAIGQLDRAVRALAQWQCNGASVPLHPGDLGWQWRFGAEATAAALRTWSRDDEILAVGFLDSPELLRVGIAPESQDDQELLHQMVLDVTEPERGVLPPGTVFIEARFASLLRQSLLDRGWNFDEPWTPLERDLTEPVEESGLRIEVVGAELAEVRAAIQRAAFENSTFSVERWHAMAKGPRYEDARCLVAYDDQNSAVAAVTVWSAGPGKPGLLEPMGVHREHRGQGYGRAITLGAAAALQRLGSSGATVCTRSSNVAAVATYRSAGFQELPEVPDLRRDA